MKESTLREILISYERKRDKADSSLKQRKNDVYKQIPQIKEIEEEISKVGLEMMRLVLKNPANKEQLCLQSKEKINELKTKKEDLLNKYNVPKGYLEIQYECPMCNDRGFLPNGKKCNCLKQAIINESYKMGDEIVNNFPASLEDLAKCEPIYEELDGWNEDITKIEKFDDLPENAKKYVARIEELIDVNVDLVSVGPGRNQTIIRKNIFE